MYKIIPPIHEALCYDKIILTNKSFWKDRSDIRYSNFIVIDDTKIMNRLFVDKTNNFFKIENPTITFIENFLTLKYDPKLKGTMILTITPEDLRILNGKIREIIHK